MSTPQDTPASDAQATLAQRLRVAADFIAAQPDLHVTGIVLDGDRIAIKNYGVNGADGLAGIARALGGRWDKRAENDLFYLSREVADGVTVELVAWQSDVCEAVVVGKETVEVPDPDAPKVTVERDIVEWRCAPILDEREQQAA